MSSTFSHRDDLIDRVLSEPARDVAFYLDSGWPGDNYESRWPWRWRWSRAGGDTA